MQNLQFWKMLTKRSLLCATVFLTLFSCQKQEQDQLIQTGSVSLSAGRDGQKSSTSYGPQVEVGNGHAWSFVTINDTDVPEEIGVILSEKTLSGLPTVNTPFVLELPDNAIAATPFKHIALGWSANGHPLPGSFIGPHFDVRFFMMSLEDRLAIPAPPAPGFSNLPPEGYMPANYLPDAPVGQLGLHWTDNSFIGGGRINHTLILGSFDGNFTFVSPIITRLELLTAQSFSIDYAQPTFFAERGYYPTTYNIYRDDELNYYISLSHFVYR